MKPARLIRRNAVYYFRYVIPKRFVSELHVKEIRKSLQTTSFETAKQRLNILNLCFDTFFYFSNRINSQKLHYYMRMIMNNFEFNNNVALALACKYTDQAESAEKKTSAEFLKEYLLPIMGEKETEKLIEDFKLSRSGLPDSLYYYKSLCTRADLETKEVRQERAAAVEMGLMQPSDFVRSPLLKDLDACRRKMKEIENKAREEKDFASFIGSTPEQKEEKAIKKRTPWLDVFKKYREDPDAKRLRVSSLDEREKRLGIAFELMDIRYIEEVTVDAVRLFYKRVAEYPANCKKLYPGLSVQKAIARAKKEGKPSVLPRTADGYMTAVSTLCDYAVKEGLISVNPTKGQKPKRTRNELRREKEARIPFPEEAIEKIFNPSTYPDREKDETKFFIPLIAYLQGMRMNEICQLTTEDIITVDGIDAIAIKEDGVKRTKNTSSERIVPIHPDLKLFGFMELVAQKRKDGEDNQLFNCYRDIRGYYSNRFSKKFSYYLKKIGLKQKDLVFHSFRHTFSVNAEMSNIPPLLINALCGWKSDEMRAQYANQFSMQDLFEAISKIKHPELDSLMKKYQQQPIS